MKNILAQIIAFAIVGAVVPAASGAESVNSINFGIGGINPMPHCYARVYTLEYEHLLTPTISVLGRGSGVNYRSDDVTYLEDGKLRGMDLGARYYPARRMQGFYVGGSLGYWNGDWTFVQNRASPGQLQGRANSNSFRLNIDAGDRIPVWGTGISIRPEVNFGKFFASSSCEYTAPPSSIGSACNQKSEVNFYLFIGIAADIAF